MDQQVIQLKYAVVCSALMSRLFKKTENHTDELELNEEYMIEDADILIIAYGSVSLGAKEAVNCLRKERRSLSYD